MLQIIIFSYNRAMQLDALLNSIHLNSMLKINFEISIIYNSSSSFYEEGYTLLKEKTCNKDVTFIKEKAKIHIFPAILFPKNFYRLIRYSLQKKITIMTNFKNIVETIIDGKKFPYVMFLTDDSFFYDKIVDHEAVYEFIERDPLQHSFSFRFGKNINFSPNLQGNNKNIFVWNYYLSKQKDWKYSFSVDGTIYHAKTLLNLIRNLYYFNPNTFEGLTHYYASKKKMYTWGSCFEQSSLITLPINIVQNICNNTSLKIATDFLNLKFLEGYSLMYELNDKPPTTVHTYPKNLYLKKGHEQKNISIGQTDAIS